MLLWKKNGPGVHARVAAVSDARGQARHPLAAADYPSSRNPRVARVSPIAPRRAAAPLREVVGPIVDRHQGPGRIEQAPDVDPPVHREARARFVAVIEPYAVEAAVDRKQRQLEPVRHADLVEHVREMVLDRLGADRKLVCNVAIGATGHDRGHDLQLARRQAEGGALPVPSGRIGAPTGRLIDVNYFCWLATIVLYCSWCGQGCTNPLTG